MASEIVSPFKKEESFLIEDLLDQRSIREAALERAAQITPFITSLTLGPNSSYQFYDDTETDSAPVILQNVSPVSTPKRKEIPRRSTSKTSPITTSDLEAMQLKLYQESEARKLREKVQKQLEGRSQIEKDHEERIRKTVEAMRLETERKQKEKAEKYDREIAMALKLEEQEEQKYQNHRIELQTNARKVIEKQERELRENLKRLEEDFNKLESIFNQIVLACNPENSKIVELHKKQFEALKEKKNANRSSLGGLKSVFHGAAELCESLKAENELFEEKAKARKAQKEAEDQRAAAAEAEAARQQAVAAVQAIPNPVSIPIPQPQQQSNVVETSPGSGRHYNELMHFLNDKHNATRQFREAKELEVLRFALKFAVNAPINHLNEQNRTSLIEGFQKLQSLLSGERVNTSKGAVSINDHPEASDWTKLRTAEKLIDVSDKKPDTVFFIAAIAVALFQQFPDFGQMFLAQLFKECPFLVPYKPRQLPGQPDVDFLRSWGYRVTDTAEKYEHYQSRTSNFATLMSAIWITFPRRDARAPHPFGIDNGWTYLVNILSSQPDPMYLHFIDKVFEAAGSTLHMTYKQQFVKLVRMVREVYLPSVENKVDEGMKGAFDRLKNITIAKFFQESRFKDPKKKLNANFW